MKRILSTAVLCAMAWSVSADDLSGIPIPPKPATSQGQVVVFEQAARGPVKPVNGVNGAPRETGTPAHAQWKHLQIPFGRTHDFSLVPNYGGARVVDVASVFRDFGADEDDPASYDFANTETPLEMNFDGSADLELRPCSFAFVELPAPRN